MRVHVFIIYFLVGHPDILIFPSSGIDDFLAADDFGDDIWSVESPLWSWFVRSTLIWNLYRVNISNLCIIVLLLQWITGFWFYWKGDGELHLHNFTNQKGSAVTRDGQIFQLKHILSISTRKQSARKEDGPLTGSSFKVSNWFLQISSFDPCHSTNLSGGLAWQSKNKDNKW